MKTKKIIGKRTGKPYTQESINVSKNSLSIRINTITGKDGEFWVVIAPSINVSGYGSNQKEAEESFDHNMDVFGDDLTSLKFDSRILELKKMGWEQQDHFKRRLSKVFVDENGALQNLENATLNSLEAVA